MTSAGLALIRLALARPPASRSARDDASQSSFVSLSWFDGDQAIAFSANTMPPNKMTVRRLNVGGAQGEGNLIADSQLIFSAPTSTNPMLPLVSADGQIVAYATYDVTHKRLTVNWHGYRVSAQTPAASKDMIAYQVTSSPQRNLSVLFDSATQWVSPSGSAVIGAWFADPGSPIRGRAYFGVMSHGTFTPLRLPREVFGQIIAW